MNELILTTYPFVILSALLTFGIMVYAIKVTSDTRAVLRWLMLGVCMTAGLLAFENGLFWYSRLHGGILFNGISNSVLVYAVKLGYGLSLWISFAAAYTAIRGRPPVPHIMFWGFAAWASVYIVIMYVTLT